MVKTVTNSSQITKILEDATRRLMEGASKEILERFKTYVEKYAYIDGTPVSYPRGFEFRDAWTWSDIKKSAKSLTMEMFNDWAEMQMSSPRGKPPFIHTTFAKNSSWPSDSRPYMASYLENLNKDVFLTGGRKGKYWSTFVKKELDSGKLQKIINKHAKANGFAVSSVSIKEI